MKINVILIALLIITISACGGRQQNTGQEQQSRPDTEIEPAQPKAATASAHPGKKVYDSLCLACHMANGTGVPGMYPPLADTDWVTGDKERLIQITIQGLSGEIEVNGVTYNNIMPPNSHLSNQEIADVLTYIRQSFGNDAGEVTVEEVQKVRADL
jgi:mono/diheme cytochrome c family protein